jgi:signal recognition particle subunit SRP19
MARPWNPDFSHSDRERWICVYPAYINSKKTVLEGRKIPKTVSVENPSYSEMRDVCAAAGLTIGVENKVHPREYDPRDARFRGRIRIQLKTDDGMPIHETFPTRKAVLLHLGEMIPKLKSRQQSSGSSVGQGGQQQGGAAGGGSKKKKGKNKK